ncbi:MAG: hypothetical protein H0T62_07910, partial [Parachlamydiaceae bacterium]|nr:hypothetical protein [Parachlamydiaceae bacterium]
NTLCWLTPDPIGDGDGPNYYAYVHNNPLLYNDPDGRLAFLIPLLTITWGAAETTIAVVTLEYLAAAAVGVGLSVVVYEGVKTLDASANGVRRSNNPFDGSVDEDIMVGDSSGNIIPVPTGHQLGGSKDGKCIQLKDKDGKPTGLRKDSRGHPPSPVHQDPRSQKPHGHVPGITNPDGTPWLPIH